MSQHTQKSDFIDPGVKIGRKRLDLDDLLAENPPVQRAAGDKKSNQRMRLLALTRWEGEGGAVSDPVDLGINPEEIHKS